jgi:asparagine synthase (glutamine-hydrolysing)
MCGITGFLDPSGRRDALAMQAIAYDMAGRLVHRGPDDEGVWVDAEVGLALGFRRLSIIDPSAEGHQPMESESDRYIVVFNGEVYNFRALRRELESWGHRFRGHSDTEVMLAAFEQWGIALSVARFNGMFAFALWDRRERVLHLARDRFGEKPLYYGWMGHTLLFGSELKAFKAYPTFEARVNRDVIPLYLRHQYIPTPYSIYEGVCQLPPGTILSLPVDNHASAEPRAYWSAREVAERGAADPFGADAAELVSRLDGLLREAVALRMVADVPLGAFLSGGVDSSVVVALMQAQSSRPVRTFSIGFHEARYNEAVQAKAIARSLGTDHTELYVTPREAMDVIPRLPAVYDEPFADPSGIPTFLAARLARGGVTVSLSGDGGDELFGGYDRYFEIARLWNFMRRMPGGLRSGGARVLRAIPPDAWQAAFHAVSPRMPVARRLQDPKQARRLAELLIADAPGALHHNVMSYWRDLAAIMPGAREPTTILTDRSRWASLPSPVQQMMYLDTVTYLPGNNLVKVDRASMAVSLETRSPLLDPHVIEFAWRVPPSLLRYDGQSKWLLRQVLYRYVPRGLMERPKMGLRAPVGEWIRGPLREWAAALLDERRLREEGFFDPGPIREAWAEHLSGKNDWHDRLWGVLMFQAWLSINK